MIGCDIDPGLLHRLDIVRHIINFVGDQIGNHILILLRKLLILVVDLRLHSLERLRSHGLPNRHLIIVILLLLSSHILMFSLEQREHIAKGLEVIHSMRKAVQGHRGFVRLGCHSCKLIWKSSLGKKRILLLIDM